MTVEQFLYSFSKKAYETRVNYHLTLGDAIIRLREIKKIDPEQIVVFDFNGESPNGVDSYRGYYSDLAVESCSDERTVTEFLKTLELAVNTTFTGYKGGENLMNESTPLWQAEYGCCGRAIVDIIFDDKIILVTKDMD